ncbi:hypothetical protein AVEN_71976-1 [Araneus ventricosus]|uniref:Uncharacterized protein n=1 Tax=Araneus ventricosus TaxID=182803 RepID=A0A4Y2MNA6_ARAVE|nr:hypothetical protein AVEN_37664-1 [Araneus ventricosus]GBN27108.1 hypothetical protein AVEN_71976-1 [Araneus ventricosus]
MTDILTTSTLPLIDNHDTMSYPTDVSLPMEVSATTTSGINPSWSTLVEEDNLRSRMNNLHVSPHEPPHELVDAPRPVRFQSRSDSCYRPGVFRWHPRPGTFATIAVDKAFVAGVLDTVWFRHALKTNWNVDVLQSLKEAGVTDVYVCGHWECLKRSAPDCVNVHLDPPERHELRYPCNVCRDRGCAVQKAYLYWRKLNRRRPCNLEH